MAFLRNIFEMAGRKSLPDFGISERTKSDPARQVFGTTFGTQPTAPQQQQILERPQLSAPTAQRPIGPLAPSGLFYENKLGTTSGGQSFTSAPSNSGSAGGGAGRVAGAATQDYNSLNQQAQDEAESDAEAQRRLLEQQGNDIFNPLVGNYQGQLDRLLSEQGRLGSGIEESSRLGQEFVGSQEQRSLQNLDQNQKQVEERGRSTLRDLAESGRNIMQATGRFIGGIGAGDSSAADLASRTIGRQALKQRGMALKDTESAIGEIDARRNDVRNIANSERIKIDQEKRNQLNSLASSFQEIQRQLETAKATASSDQRRYIASEQNRLREELTGRLQQLDDEYRGRVGELEDWNRSRAAQLEDAARRIGASGQFSGINDFMKRQEAYSNIRDNGIDSGLSLAEANQLANQYVPLYSPSDLLRISQNPAEDPEDKLNRLKAEQGIKELETQSTNNGFLGNLATSGNQPGWF